MTVAPWKHLKTLEVCRLANVFGENSTLMLLFEMKSVSHRCSSPDGDVKRLWRQERARCGLLTVQAPAKVPLYSRATLMIAPNGS